MQTQRPLPSLPWQPALPAREPPYSSPSAASSPPSVCAQASPGTRAAWEGGARRAESGVAGPGSWLRLVGLLEEGTSLGGPLPPTAQSRCPSMVTPGAMCIRGTLSPRGQQ